MLIFYEDNKGLFNYSHTIDDKPNNSNFKLHNHNEMQEIIYFIKGNSEFHVEGTVYYLKPHDVVITNSAEMHRIYHKEPFSEYDRVVLHLHNGFFTKNNCEEFKKIFTARALGENNVISGEIIKNYGITESIDRYLKENKKLPEIVIKSKIIELLYNLNQMSVKFEKHGYSEGQIKAILVYINENITSQMTLESISEHFYINKYHLCHIFKKQTGFTVNKYIAYKRILLVRELYSQGKTLLEASTLAGFSNYSNFYKIYKNETGKSPKEDLKP